MNKMLDELIEQQELLGSELEDLDGLGEMWPIIQWVNDPKSLTERPDSKRGGFIMADEHMELAGDIPSGATANVIEFGPSDDAPNGSEVDCVYAPMLTFVPLGKRKAWFAGRTRLQKDFDWDAVVNRTGENPKSKLQVHALVQGEAGLFLARITFSSTIAKDALGALRDHNRNVQVALKKAGIKNRSLKVNGWRWFWTTLAAQEMKMRGSPKAQSKVTPVGLRTTGDYIGTDLRDQYFDLVEIQTFEDMWKQAPEQNVVQPAAPAYPEEPDSTPPEDDTRYDHDIPF